MTALSATTVYWLSAPLLRSVFRMVPTVPGMAGRVKVALVMTPVMGAVMGNGLAPDLAVITSVDGAGALSAMQGFPKSFGGAACAGEPTPTEALTRTRTATNVRISSSPRRHRR